MDVRSNRFESLNVYEKEVFSRIKKATDRWNMDNISRTKAYQSYFLRNPELFWPFLASMVSRNAGWNMGDLILKEFRVMMRAEDRRWIFDTYERANWLIFSDAYPQLLVYEASKQASRPLFHLLEHFHVSSFMETEWKRYWEEKGRNRLDTALIINEQNLIQKPVIENPRYQTSVFNTMPFWLQERFHFSTVLFPTRSGDLYGLSVHGFKKLRNRIILGKRLLALLTSSCLKDHFIRFAIHTEPTGARTDYEQYFRSRGYEDHCFPLRAVYPIIGHHRQDFSDWSKSGHQVEPFFKPVKLPKHLHLNEWYAHKRYELYVLSKVKAHLL